MATTHSVQKELDALRKELAGLKSDYNGLKKRASASEGLDTAAALKEELSDTIASLRDKVANGTGAAVDDITEQLNELRDAVSRYSEKAEETVTAHPLATVATALAIGYLIGRLKR